MQSIVFQLWRHNVGTWEFEGGVRALQQTKKPEGHTPPDHVFSLWGSRGYQDYGLPLRRNKQQRPIFIFLKRRPHIFSSAPGNKFCGDVFKIRLFLRFVSVDCAACLSCDRTQTTDDADDTDRHRHRHRHRHRERERGRGSCEPASVSRHCSFASSQAKTKSPFPPKTGVKFRSFCA